MHEKRVPLLDEESKYKKKSKSKGQPRSKHKHIYETVLLTRHYCITDYKTGEPKIIPHVFPTKVCTICGRIGEVDHDQAYYTKTPISNLPFSAFKETLSEKAFELPKWHTEDYWDKFATKNQEGN